MTGRARTFRKSLGPVEVYAYHDRPTQPWNSALMAGVWIGSANAEVTIWPESGIRPFSDGN